LVLSLQKPDSPVAMFDTETWQHFILGFCQGGFCFFVMHCGKCENGRVKSMSHAQGHITSSLYIKNYSILYKNVWDFFFG
jgi:hypothetical protein